MLGTDFHSLARPLREAQWTYIAALPVETFDGPARAFLRNAVVTAAIALAFGSLLVLLFARSVAADLRRVTLAAKGLAQGDLDQALEVRSNDELGQMAAAFQEMI